MNDFVTELVTKGVLLPLLVSFTIVGVVESTSRFSDTSLFAPAALTLGVILTYTAVSGWPDFPPRTSTQKVAYVALFGLIVGLAMDIRDFGRAIKRAAAVIWPAVIIAWLSWRQLQDPSMPFIITALSLWLLSSFALFVLSEHDRTPGAPGVTLLMAAIGGAFVAVFGASSSVAQTFGTLAAATGGFMLWNWPKPRFQFGALGAIGGGGVLVALATQATFFTDASQLALSVIALAFLAPIVTKRLTTNLEPGWSTIVVAIAAGLPALAAAAAAYFITGQGIEALI